MSKLILKVPDWKNDFSDSIWEGFKEQGRRVSSVNRELGKMRDLELFKEWLLDKEKWRFPRVSFDTFLDDPEYLGIGDKIYPAIRKMAKDIIDNNYSEGVIVAGIGCVAGETKVFNPITGIHQRIDSLNESFVYAKGKNSFCVKPATRPKQYKKTNLYKVTTQRGNTIIVTKKHKFYEISGQWKTLSSLTPSSNLLISGGAHPLTILEFCLSMLLSSVQSFLKKGVNFLNRCSTYFRQYGQQPLAAKASVLNASPSQDGVLEHNLYRWKTDANEQELSGSQIYQLCSLRAMQGSPHRSKTSEGGAEFCTARIKFEQPQKIFQLSLLLQLWNALKQVSLFLIKVRCWFWLAYTNHTLRYEKIKSIKFEREDIYYDLHVPELNNYLANGFVNHNSGKTLASELIACYATHTLLCLRNPHKTYKLAKDKPITIMNMGVTATQALEVTFAGIKNLISKSAFFNRFNPQILQGKIRFLDNNILLISGNSKSTTPLGYNIFYAILDEAAFYMDNDNKQIAEEIYTALQRRIVSRFGYDGLILMISSPRYEGDFIMRKLEEARKFPELIYSKQVPTWKCRRLLKEDLLDCFYFNNRSGLVEKTPPTGFGDINKIAEKFNSKADIWQIPGEYKKSFLQDPDKAKRDFAAIPSLTIQGFLPHQDIIKTMFTEDEIPITSTGDYKFKEPPLRVNYFIHIDLALNKAGKGDCAGFAMAHFGGWEVNEITGERQKTVVVDLAEQIRAGATGEIRFEDVRNKIYALKKMGFNIKLVSLDSFQCLRQGTKIPVVTFDQFQSLLYNKVALIEKNMPLSKTELIPLLKGIDKRIEDIKPNDYVYSINKKGDVGFGKVLNTWSSGKKEIFRVHLDNGRHIDCSSNHPFMLRDGSYRQVKDLKAGDSLMPLYRKEGMADLRNYEMILHPRGKWEYTHRAIMRQKYEIRKGLVIHHKNANKRNNEPTNLESLTKSDHHKLHADLGRKGLVIARESLANNLEALERKNKAFSEMAKKRWREHPDKMKRCLAEGNKLRWNKLDEHKKMSSFISERNKILPVRKGTKTSEIARKRFSEAGKKLWQTEEHKEKMLKRPIYYGEKAPRYDKTLTIEILKQNVDKKLSVVCQTLNTTSNKIRRRIQKLGFKTWKEFCSTVNHKVVSVEALGFADDVWDIEVEGTHNFATSAGVFVHNSSDTLQVLRAKGIKAEYLSVDRTVEPYQTLKELIYSGRIKCHAMPKLLEELSRLEITKANKIDHSPSSSKDISDAVCGAVYQVMQQTGGELGMSTGAISSTPSTISATREKSEKEKHYEFLQDLAKQGLI